MTAQRLDRLTSTDATLLAQESDTAHMQIGTLALLEGPPPKLPDFLAHVRSRLDLVPRYRQKLAVAPLEAGRPLWADDPRFNLDYHVRHTALPEPGDHAALLALCGRIFSQSLDRSKPLWELWLVEGLDAGSWALIAKAHHALVDGVTAVDLATVLYDRSRRPRARAAPEPWIPRPEPSGAALAARGIEGAARAAAGALSAAARPDAALALVRRVAGGIGGLARTALGSSPDTPLHATVGPHRRVATVRADLEVFKEIKDAFQTTVNDVVLAVLTGALADFLRSRGRRTDGLELQAAVPVSVRAPGEDGRAGSRLSQVLAPLPVFLEDPVARLRHIKVSMDDVKQSHDALAASAIAGLEGFAAPTLHAQASRLDFTGGAFDLLVTNVPGTQRPLYVLGQRLDAMYPISFLAGEHALAVAVMSYDGGMDFGLLADFDALPDLDEIAEDIVGSLAELLARARVT